jgi:pyrimidine operon attenuation protein/uracil phosphoribosyltransferase
LTVLFFDENWSILSLIFDTNFIVTRTSVRANSCQTKKIENMKILNEKQIRQKIRRLTIEILERNFNEPEIILAGINNNGLEMANLLLQELVGRTEANITLTRLHLNPASPTQHPIVLEMPIEQVEDKVVIIVDDVANTGRTIYYALKPLLDVLPKKVEVAVLVDRKHKSFPIQADYVGLSLATTLKESIEVKIREVDEWAVFLH